MAEPSLPFGNTVRKFLHRFPDLKYEGGAIKCTVCRTFLAAWHLSNCKKHCRSKKHIKNRQRKTPNWTFYFDLLFTLSVCNIPTMILNRNHFIRFWSTYVPNFPLPTMNRIHRYFPRVKQQIEDNIRSEIRNKKLWLTVAGSTDSRNNDIGHVVVRVLTPNTPTKPYLLASKRLGGLNAKTIEKLVLDTLKKFKIDRNNVLMVVSPDTEYIIQAVRALKNQCPNLLHVTCVLYAIHQVTEWIRTFYVDVDTLIASTQKIFQHPDRLKEFQRVCHGIPEPPQTESARLSIWLQAALYYLNHLQTIRSIVFQFDPNLSRIVQQSQKLLNSSHIEEDLRSIQDNYQGLVDAVEQLHDSSLSLTESFNIINRVHGALASSKDSFGIELANHFEESLKRNPGLVQLREKCSSDDSHYFTHAHITSADAERSFSNYEAILIKKRSRLKEATVEGSLIMQVFASTRQLPTWVPF